MALLGELSRAHRAQPQGLDYERVPVNLPAGEQRGDAHLARNPQGFVPVLFADGRC